MDLPSALGYDGPWNIMVLCHLTWDIMVRCHLPWDIIVLGIQWSFVICLGIPWSFTLKVLGPFDVMVLGQPPQFSVWSTWVLANGAKTLVFESACTSLEEGKRTSQSGAPPRWLHAKTVTDFGSGSWMRINV